MAGERSPTSAMEGPATHLGANGDAWITCPAPRAQARLRLLCLPQAGGNASSYRTWASRLPVDIEVLPVQLPGRGNRINEPPLAYMKPLVDALLGVLQGRGDRPLAFFGHSMGALVGYELAQRLREEGQSEPLALCVSGHRAPHLPLRRRRIHDLPEAAFVRELRRLNGTPEELLRDPELRELMLPTLRADFAVCETYVYKPRSPLDCPLIAYGGLDDNLVGYSEVAAWRQHTHARFRIRMLRGDHFFPQTAEASLLAAIGHDMLQLAGRA